jgi:hypothetical protein
MSGTSTPARYHSDIETSSNSRLSPVEVDVCFPATPSKKEEEEGGIDYEALEEFVLLEKKELAEQKPRTRPRRLSTMGGSDRRYSMYGDRMKVGCLQKLRMHSFLCIYIYIYFIRRLNQMKAQINTE